MCSEPIQAFLRPDMPNTLGGKMLMALRRVWYWLIRRRTPEAMMRSGKLVRLNMEFCSVIQNRTDAVATRGTPSYKFGKAMELSITGDPAIAEDLDDAIGSDKWVEARRADRLQMEKFLVDFYLERVSRWNGGLARPAIKWSRPIERITPGTFSLHQ